MNTFVLYGRQMELYPISVTHLVHESAPVYEDRLVVLTVK